MGNYFAILSFYWELRVKFIFTIANFSIEKNSFTNYDFQNTKNCQVFYHSVSLLKNNYYSRLFIVDVLIRNWRILYTFHYNNLFFIVLYHHCNRILRTILELYNLRYRSLHVTWELFFRRAQKKFDTSSKV